MFIFFDLDRTLIDFDTASEKGIKTIFENFNSEIKMNFNEFMSEWKKWAQIYFDEYSQGKWTHWEQKRLRLWKTFAMNGVELSNEEADRRFKIYEKIYEDNIQPFSDVFPVLENLKNSKIQMGIITNGEEPQQYKKLERFNLKKYFDPVVVSSSAGVSKPDPEIGRIAAAKIGNPSSNEIWFVGDSLAHDIPLALELKWNPVFINRSKKEFDIPKGTFEIHNLEELLSLLKK